MWLAHENPGNIDIKTDQTAATQKQHIHLDAPQKITRILMKHNTKKIHLRTQFKIATY